MLALVAIVAGLILASFSGLNNRQTLDKEVDNIKSIIQKTRLESLNSKNGSTHRIIFDTNSVTTAETGTTTTRTYLFSSSVVMQTNGLKEVIGGAATSSVAFAKLSGLASAIGTITYIFNGGSTGMVTRTVTINALGTVE
jgi:Tfp pilus assembly protein FimT